MPVASDTLDLLIVLLRGIVLGHEDDQEVALADLLYDLGCNKSVAELVTIVKEPRQRQTYHPTKNLDLYACFWFCQKHPEEQASEGDWLELIDPDRKDRFLASYLTTELHKCRLLACWLGGLVVPSDWVARMLTADVRGDHVRTPPVLIV